MKSNEKIISHFFLLENTQKHNTVSSNSNKRTLLNLARLWHLTKIHFKNKLLWFSYCFFSGPMKWFYRAILLYIHGHMISHWQGQFKLKTFSADRNSAITMSFTIFKVLKVHYFHQKKQCSKVLHI